MCNSLLVRPGGFEPLAFRVGAERSIQLSYDRTICTDESVQYSIAQPLKKMQIKTSAAIPQPDAVQAVRDERLTVEDGRAAGVPDGRGQIAGGVELRLRAKLGAEMVSQPVQHPGQCRGQSRSASRRRVFLPSTEAGAGAERSI